MATPVAILSGHQVAPVKQQTFEREITKWLNVSIRFEGVNATISVGSTPRLVVDVSQVEELVVQDGPGGRPAIEIVSSGVQVNSQ